MGIWFIPHIDQWNPFELWSMDQYGTHWVHTCALFSPIGWWLLFSWFKMPLFRYSIYEKADTALFKRFFGHQTYKLQCIPCVFSLSSVTFKHQLFWSGFTIFKEAIFHLILSVQLLSISCWGHCPVVPKHYGHLSKSNIILPIKKVSEVSKCFCSQEQRTIEDLLKHVVTHKTSPSSGWWELSQVVIHQSAETNPEIPNPLLCNPLHPL